MNGDIFDAAPATRRRFLASASAAAILLAAGCSDGTDDSKTPGAGRTPAAAAKEKKGMDFAELIEARRSVRRYAASAMPEGEMQKIVADALNAPSWKNSETTRYYAATGKDAKDRMWKEALPSFNAANSANAAALVAVAFVPGVSGFGGDGPANELGDMWGAYDCGLASSYFILAAKNRGWDTLVMGIRDAAKVKEIIAQTGATSMKDMGKVMGIASKQMAGQADGGAISKIVRSILA